jgi:hypothetical protein
MKDVAKLVGWIVAVVVFATILFLGVRVIVAPSTVAIDNAVFHNSQAYQDGMANDLASFQQDYMNTNDESKKAAIRAIVLQRYGSYSGPLPLNLQSFLSQLRNGG